MAGVITLEATERSVFGKALHNERAAGKLPAVVYGPKESTSSCFVDAKIFEKLWHEAGESTVIALSLGGTTKDVLIHEVARHPVTGKPIHADFYAVEAGKPIRVHVPLTFTGESPAVKNLGAVLIKVLHELEVEALPRELPHELTVSIDSLETLESQLFARDVTLPKGVTLITNPDEVVAAIAEVKEEEEAPAPMDISQIEVEKKGKKEEEGEAAETPAGE